MPVSPLHAITLDFAPCCLLLTKRYRLSSLAALVLRIFCILLVFVIGPGHLPKYGCYVISPNRASTWQPAISAAKQEEQITRNILTSWQVQRSMHSEVKKVLEMAKRKKRNERVVRLVDAAARGDIAEVPIAQSLYFWSILLGMLRCSGRHS